MGDNLPDVVQYRPRFRSCVSSAIALNVGILVVLGI